jgi:iron complex transport system substrate-binding protein
LYRVIWILLLFSPSLGSPVWVDGIEVIDDVGRSVRLERPALRILALYGAYNEILAAMGLEDRLVGRTKADVIPPSIMSRPAIGTHLRPNVEMVLGLSPELVVQGGGRREALSAVTQLRQEGLEVAVFNPTTFSQLFSVIRRLGVLTDEKNGAERLVASLKNRLERVRERLHGISSRPSVFFEVRYPNLLGAGRGSIVNDVIDRAGGVNCLELEKKLVRIDMEALIACDPEAYVIQRGPMNPNPGEPEARPHFAILGAVKGGRVLFVDEQVYSRPGPRSVDAVEELAAFLHPVRFQ